MAIDTLRKCIVTGNTFPKDQLLRFVFVDGVGIVPDFKKRLNGKGIYVTNSKNILSQAIKNNLFAKACKKKLKVDDSLIHIVENTLQTQALHAISLARKAGCVIWGLDKALEAIKKGKVAFVLEAQDAGEDGHRKIVSHAKDLPIYSLFNSKELDEELKRENTIHLVFTKNHMSEAVEDTFVRLASFINN